jgi:hypothetical protein
MCQVDEERKVKGVWKYLLLVGVFCFLAYVRGLSNLFVAEDFSLIGFSSQDFATVWKLSLTANRVRPLPFYVGWLLYRILGVAPAGYHLFILVLHILNCILVFFLGSRLGKDERVGLITALLFSVYPRHHQPVLWLAADQFILVCVFMLASLLCFDRYLRTGRVWFQVGALVCLCLAVASNELAVVTLPLLFLMEVVSCRSRQQGWCNLLHIKTFLKYVPHLIFLIAYLVVIFGGDRLFKLNPVAEMTRAASEGWRSETYHLMLGTSQVKDLIAYLTYLVYPQIPLRSLDVGLVAGLMSGLAMLFLLFLLVKGSSVVRFAVLWLGLTLAPFVLFVPFGNADRYFYVAAFGFSLLGGLFGCWAYDRLKVRFAGVARVAMIFVLGGYLISSVLFLQQRIDEWREAGEIAADIIAQAKDLYPSVPAGSTMVFVALPGQHKQAYVFLGGGIGDAINLAYREQLSPPSAYQTREPGVISFLKEAEPVDQPLPGLYVFLYDDRVLHDKTGVVDSLEPLQKSTWYR